MTDAAPAATLTVADSTLLLHPLCQAVGRDHGIRVLSIKGPVLSAQSLRPERVSNDADVWVDPAELDRFIAALESHGWRRRALVEAPALIGAHSVTMLHPLWACELDVHRTYPWMLREPPVAFDVVWARSTTLPFAGIDCRVTDRATSLVIMAVHALRDHEKRPSQSEFQLAEEAYRADADLAADVVDVARATGALVPLRPLLADAVDPTEFAAADADAAMWRRALATADLGATPGWLHALKVQRGGDRWRTLWHAVWPDADYIAMWEPALGATRWGRTRLRLRRFRRAIVRVPSALLRRSR